MQVDSVASGLGATAAFFKDFFPTAFAHLSTGWPALWSLVQPGWLAEQCPEQQLIGGAFAIRNPSLLPWQAAGVAVAAAGLRRLRGPAHAYLRASLLLFAGMNLCSVICHALAARGSPLWHASRLADIACTGGSSLCLLLHQVRGLPGAACRPAPSGWLRSGWGAGQARQCDRLSSSCLGMR